MALRPPDLPVLSLVRCRETTHRGLRPEQIEVVGLQQLGGMPSQVDARTPLRVVEDAVEHAVPAHPPCRIVVVGRRHRAIDADVVLAEILPATVQADATTHGADGQIAHDLMARGEGPQMDTPRVGRSHKSPAGEGLAAHHVGDQIVADDVASAVFRSMAGLPLRGLDGTRPIRLQVGPADLIPLDHIAPKTKPEADGGSRHMVDQIVGHQIAVALTGSDGCCLGIDQAQVVEIVVRKHVVRAMPGYPREHGDPRRPEAGEGALADDIAAIRVVELDGRAAQIPECAGVEPAVADRIEHHGGPSQRAGELHAHERHPPDRLPGGSL